MQTLQQAVEQKPRANKRGVDLVMVSFRCPRELRRRLLIHKAEQDTTVEALCAEALQRYLEAAKDAA